MKLPIQDAVNRAELADLVNVIPFELIDDKGVVLLQPTANPELAFIVWETECASGGGRTHIVLRNEPEKDNSYRVYCVCGCALGEINAPQVKGQRCRFHSASSERGNGCYMDSDCDTWIRSNKILEAWKKERGTAFRSKLFSCCHQHGVTNLIVRKAEKWAEYYGECENLSFLESTTHPFEFLPAHIARNPVSADPERLTDMLRLSPVPALARIIDYNRSMDCMDAYLGSPIPDGPLEGLPKQYQKIFRAALLME